MSPNPGLLRRAFGSFWSVLDTSRRVILNLIFLIILVAIIAAVFRGGTKIEEKTALVLDLKGKLVEQRAGGTRDRLLSELQGAANEQTPLRDVLAVLAAAAKDARIERVVLVLDDFGGGGKFFELRLVG